MRKCISTARNYDDVDNDEDFEDNVDEDNDDCEEDLEEEEVGNNSYDKDDENEDDDVQENDEHTEIDLIHPKCATLGAKKRSIIVSSIEEPIRKSSRNRTMNSFLTDFV